MKQLYIVGNWKANKTTSEADDWLQKISNFKFLMSNDEEKTVILCPPVELLQEVKRLVQEYKLPFAIGAQDVSAFSEGAHTGDVTAVQLKEFVTYVIVAHSERREKFHESEDLLREKVEQAHVAGLTTIFCVSNLTQQIPEQVTIVAYEPLEAIGSGVPDSPEHANDIARQIKEKNPHIQFVLYGGSVTGKNVKAFTSQEQISGVLVGTDSLDAKKFSAIIQNG